MRELWEDPKDRLSMCAGFPLGSSKACNRLLKASYFIVKHATFRSRAYSFLVMHVVISEKHACEVSVAALYAARQSNRDLKHLSKRLAMTRAKAAGQRMRWCSVATTRCPPTKGYKVLEFAAGVRVLTSAAGVHAWTLCWQCKSADLVCVPCC
jgi:hypothetical protein